MERIIIGQIIKDNTAIGTGFLIASDIVMTVKHNVILPSDLIKEESEWEEKEIIFRLGENDDVKGKTINLIKAIKKGIDCVYILLEERLSVEEISVLVENENSIGGYSCNIIGFPKLAQGKINLSGNIISENQDIFIHIHKADGLQSYEGLSGAPLIIAGNVVGIVKRQENSENLVALSIKEIVGNLGQDNFQVEKRSIPQIGSSNNFTFNVLKQKTEQIIGMAGPRYSQELNIETDLFKNLTVILKKNGIKKRLDKISNRIIVCINALKRFKLQEQYGNLISKKSQKFIDELIIQLQNDLDILENHTYEEERLESVVDHLKEYEIELSKIFYAEKTRFDEKNGEGAYDSRAWRGYMATYMCATPTKYIDDLKSIMKTLHEMLFLLDIDLIRKLSRQAILIYGKGGIGKTHLLCDIVRKYLDRNLPAVLFLGELFERNSTADVAIMDWYNKGGEIEEFFSWLNEVGHQNNVYIPICIDAINEVSDRDYWNKNISLLLAKLENYKNIKIIFSCRSIYVKEYLEDDKIIKLLQLEHNGFNNIEVEALASFCAYYDVNINYKTANIPEFLNPLFLKMLCEIAREQEDKTVIVDDIQNLMNKFFSIKNKVISKEYEDNLSVNDNIVPVVLGKITDCMVEREQYSISWGDLRRCVSEVLEEFGIKEKTAGFIKMLLSENLLRESDGSDNQITFAYQKFYEFIYSQKFENKKIEEIVCAVEGDRITLGTLEMIQLSYFRRNQEEFIDNLNGRIHKEAVESFINGLYWRNNSEVNDKTIGVIEKLGSSYKVSDIRQVIMGLISISTKIDCMLNALYLHDKLKNMGNIRRDRIFSFFLLKQYDNIKVVSDFCERAILLDNTVYSEEKTLLWKIMLCWGTGSNDIKLRDKASKGLVNLFRLYPENMLKVIYLFSNVTDDYIQERIWQSIYSTIIILQEEKYLVPIMAYIKKELICKDKWPQNVLIRDYLRNIFEYAYYKGWCSEEEISIVRPPYRSSRHKVNEEFISKYKEKFSELYWNCQDSDFATYTIPHEVTSFGLRKKDVGLMVFEDILKNGYNNSCAIHDRYIDQKYGLLRNRDEQVERIGKKYQKIYLYREIGNIYDNYEYSPGNSYDCIETIFLEQGNPFREIDLTILNPHNMFSGVKLEYPFYRYSKWKEMQWFENKDIEKYIPRIISTNYKGKEYYILQGYLSSKERSEKGFREIWMQLRTYFYSKNKKEELLKWFDGKDFEGRWMPEGGEIYACCFGEYPWSPLIVNYLDEENEQDFSRHEAAPCNLITTISDYNAEKDSSFCNNKDCLYMLPSKYLFEHMNLVWDGSVGYCVDNQTVILNAKNNTIFVEKEFLIDFLNKNQLDIVWTILGEKQKITGSFMGEFPGRSEFSYTYYLNENLSLIRNHEVYNIINPSS